MSRRGQRRSAHAVGSHPGLGRLCSSLSLLSHVASATCMPPQLEWRDELRGQSRGSAGRPAPAPLSLPQVGPAPRPGEDAYLVAEAAQSRHFFGLEQARAKAFHPVADRPTAGTRHGVSGGPSTYARSDRAAYARARCLLLPKGVGMTTGRLTSQLVSQRLRRRRERYASVQRSRPRGNVRKEPVTSKRLLLCMRTRAANGKRHAQPGSGSGAAHSG